MLDFRQVAEALRMDVEMLRVLNPQYRRDIVPGNVKPSVLKLPAADTYSFVDKEDSIFSLATALEAGLTTVGDKHESITHVVQSGENLVTIADKYGVTARDIRRWNGLGSNRVTAGKRLRLNVDNGGIAFNSTTASAKQAATTQTAAAKTPARTTTTPTAAAQELPVGQDKGFVTYRVQSGDSLYSISRKYPGTSVAALQRANNLSGTNIRPGQILKIPIG
jgi:membrane-bound lytic murein transglycosylase D